MVRPEIQAEVDRIIAGFRLECRRVLEETARLQRGLPEPPEGWREYFTRRIYTAFLKYKEDVEAVVEAHLAGQGKA
ncbi:MAG: hypothetical protein HYZ03_06730 [candidate division NC10 bacterium]|nr:hypothetical protein [candidate division NC10 bacterium]